jgi:hypothetical protein
LFPASVADRRFAAQSKEFRDKANVTEIGETVATGIPLSWP